MTPIGTSTETEPTTATANEARAGTAASEPATTERRGAPTAALPGFG